MKKYEIQNIYIDKIQVVGKYVKYKRKIVLKIIKFDIIQLENNDNQHDDYHVDVEFETVFGKKLVRKESWSGRFWSKITIYDDPNIALVNL